MCILWPTEELRSIRRTNIFARHDGVRQLLVYQMHMEANGEVAMVLPLPVKHASEDACRFLDLERCGDFFSILRETIPEPELEPTILADSAVSLRQLEVQDVGAYEATFVPTQADFSRVDERFRLPEFFWESVPQYADWGFAVFQLKPGRKERHPMAFVFETRLSGRLFFPTLHLHGSHVDESADFDHELYAQGLERVVGHPSREEALAEFLARNSTDLEDPGPPNGVIWSPPENPEGFVHSEGPAAEVLNEHSGPAEVCDPSDFIFRRTIEGRHKNADFLVPAQATATVSPPSVIGVGRAVPPEEAIPAPRQRPRGPFDRR